MTFKELIINIKRNAAERARLKRDIVWLKLLIKLLDATPDGYYKTVLTLQVLHKVFKEESEATHNRYKAVQ